VKRAFVPRREQTRVDKPFQMMAERRSGQVDVGLNIPRRCPSPVSLHHKSQDLQTQRVTQRTKLRCVLLELRTHAATSNIFEVVTQALKFA